MISCFAEIKIFQFWPKTMDYSPWFDIWESKKVGKLDDLADIIGKSISRGAECTNFSFVAPSSDELWMFKKTFPPSPPLHSA